MTDRIVSTPPVLVADDGTRVTISTFTSSPMLAVEEMDGSCGWTHQVWVGGVHLVYRCTAPAHGPDVDHEWQPA